MMQFTRRSLFTLLTLAALAPSFLGAQTTSTVRGRVNDARTGEPIPSSQVSVEGTQLGASTTRHSENRSPLEPVLAR